MNSAEQAMPVTTLTTNDTTRLKKTTCPYCGVGCGVDAKLFTEDSSDADIGSQPGSNLSYIESVNGTSDHPANFGKLCVKGSALNLTTESRHRLLTPRDKNGSIDWDTALDTVVQRFQETIVKHGPDSVAFYLSGQLLTEDYYVANKLMKGFIGSANVDTNSRLCMASAVVGYKRAFGVDAVPCSYEDLEVADLIVLIGSNAAWTHPVLYQRIAAEKKRRVTASESELKIVLVDPRKTASMDIVDLHLSVKPASDGFLFNGLLHYLINNEHIDEHYIAENTNGFYTAKDNVESANLSATATATGLQLKDLATFFEWFAQTDKAISFYSQGINQSSTGSDKCNAIINCHLATAKIGKPGAGPFSITGQPNAMGGREVGGLANQLAAHMDFDPDDVDRVQRFWQSPTIATEPGLKAVDLFDAIDAGKVKAVWVMATNPAVSLPNSNVIRQALEKCDFVAVSDYVENDTSIFADIVMPSTAWGEKDGTVTNSERRISRQRPLRASVGDARHDWWQLKEVAKRMGYAEQFAYESPADVFREHADLSGFEQDKRLRDFDISALADLSDREFEELTPVQWPVNAKNPQGTKRLLTDGKFFTPDRKANFLVNMPRLQERTISLEHPLMLNTGRIRDQWHTMTRTGTSANLLSHIHLPFIEVNADDINRYQLTAGHLATLKNEFGEFIGEVAESDVQVGQVFAPIHWTDQFAYKGVISSVVAPNVDAFSGQPESKAIPVSVSAMPLTSWGMLALSQILLPAFEQLLKQYLAEEKIMYWSRSPLGVGSQHECFFLALSDDFQWLEMISKIQLNSPDMPMLRFGDEINDDNRLALMQGEQVALLAYSHPERKQLPSQHWFGQAVDGEFSTSPSSLMLGENGASEKTICTCFQVTDNQIKAAIKDGCSSTDELGETLKCGTNCGSCLPELTKLLQKSA